MHSKLTPRKFHILAQGRALVIPLGKNPTFLRRSQRLSSSSTVKHDSGSLVGHLLPFLASNPQTTKTKCLETLGSALCNAQDSFSG